MVRAPFIDKNGVKKGAWSKEEDMKLSAYVHRFGHSNWRLVPQFAGLNRCGKSCRLRWINYLQPNVKRGDYTKEEIDLIKKLHDEHGNKWAEIAKHLPQRTDNEIKNFWHTHFHKRDRTRTGNKSAEIQKRIAPQKSSESCSIQMDCLNSSEILQSGLKQEKSEVSSSDVYILESTPTASNSGVSEADWDMDSFVEQIRCEMQSMPSDSLEFNWGRIDESVSFTDSFTGLIQESCAVDASYVQEFDFSPFGDYGYFNLGFDDDEMKLFEL